MTVATMLLAGCKTGLENSASVSPGLATALGDIIPVTIPLTRSDRLKATVDGIPAKVFDTDEEGTIDVLLPSETKTGSGIDLEVFEGNRLLLRHKLNVKPAPYVRLILSMQEGRVSLVSAAPASGDPSVRRQQESDRLLSILLRDSHGHRLYRTFIPFPASQGIEIHGASRSGTLARADARPKHYFSVKVPRFSNRFTVEFSEIKRRVSEIPNLPKSRGQVEVRL